MKTYINENLPLNALKRLSMNLLFVVEVGTIIAGGVFVAYMLFIYMILILALR